MEMEEEWRLTEVGAEMENKLTGALRGFKSCRDGMGIRKSALGRRTLDNETC